MDGAAKIQAFVTTHSPAFYSVFRDADRNSVSLFLVAKDETQPKTKVRPLENVDLTSLDSSMGLLALLEQHFKEARQELDKLRSAVRSLTDTSKPTIFCEGPSDKCVFEEGLHLLFPAHATEVAVRCSNHHGGGHTWVAEMLIAWSFSRPLAKAVGVFDRDADALRTKKESTAKLNVPPSGKKAFGVALKPSPELKTCYSRSVAVPFAVEELFPEEIWDFAEKQGWLEDRPDPMTLYEFGRQNITFDSYLQEVLSEKHLYRLALKKVMLAKKQAFTKHVCGIGGEAERRRLFGSVKPTLEECLRQLDVIS